jgi:hypothetical protein
MPLQMDHKAAVSENRLERYLLRELSAEERDAFEEHYFSCPVCAQELVTAAKFIENAKRPLLRLVNEAPVTNTAADPKSGKRPSPKEDAGERWWDRWLALAPKPALVMACAGLAAVVFVQGFNGGDRPEVTGGYFVTSTRNTGVEPKKISIDKNKQKIAWLLNRTDLSVARYRFTLEDATRAVLTFEDDAPRDSNDVMVLLPVKGLAAGRYTLRVKDAATGSETAALPFELMYP